MKLRRLITRRRAKWVGVVLCVLLATVFVSSRWVTVGNSTKSATGVDWLVVITGGRLEVSRFDFRGLALDYMSLEDLLHESAIRLEVDAQPGLRLWFDWGHVSTKGGNELTWFECPLWMPLLLLAVPTAWLWRVDRRVQPWQCRTCRYDLRGLEGGGDGGVCPECGKPFAADI